MSLHLKFQSLLSLSLSFSLLPDLQHLCVSFNRGLKKGAFVAEALHSEYCSWSKLMKRSRMEEEQEEKRSNLEWVHTYRIQVNAAALAMKPFLLCSILLYFCIIKHHVGRETLFWRREHTSLQSRCSLLVHHSELHFPWCTRVSLTFWHQRTSSPTPSYITGVT